VEEVSTTIGFLSREPEEAQRNKKTEEAKGEDSGATHGQRIKKKTQKKDRDTNRGPTTHQCIRLRLQVSPFFSPLHYNSHATVAVNYNSLVSVAGVRDISRLLLSQVTGLN